MAGRVLPLGVSLIGGTARCQATAPEGIIVFPGIDAIAAACDVVIDFTHRESVVMHAEACVRAQVGWVLGTTGLNAADQAVVNDAATKICVVQAANFAPGVALMLELARQLAAALPADTHDAEILEMHHRQKLDAPSGTALALGKAVAAGRGVDFEDVALRARHGHTGTRQAGSIGFAALRGGQVIGDHSVMFAAEDEQIVLTHHALDRGIFAVGAVRAALWTAGRKPGLYSMLDVLGIAER